MTGAAMVWVHYLPHWGKTADPAVKLGCFATAPAIDSRWANVLSELSGTFFLVFGIFAIGANEFTEGFKPLVVGFFLVVVGMAFGGTTGYAINPARDFGPRLVHFLLPIAGKGASGWRYSWVPVIGPIIGGIYGGLSFEATIQRQCPAIVLAYEPNCSSHCWCHHLHTSENRPYSDKS